jgi:two-component system, NtrC family, nitrogen regulation sensor histidine kinase NtrY
MSAGAEAEASTRLRRVLEWATRVGLSRKLAFALAIGAVISGITTYGALTGSLSPEGVDPNTILILLNIDLVLLLPLGALVAWRLVRLWIARRQGFAGARLQGRMVGMFSIVAVAPAIIVAVFSATFFNLGIQSWFNDRVRTALERSLAVSEAYLSDHRSFIRADILSMVAVLNRQPSALLDSPEALNRIVDALVVERSLAEAIITRGDGKVLARSQLSFVLEFDPIENSALRRAAEGEVVIMTSDASDRVRALARIDAMIGAYLYVGRFVDSTVLNHMSRLTSAVNEYQDLESRHSGIQITFTLLYVTVALMLLLASVWMGLMFSNRLIGPISALVGATQRVRDGDLTVRVDEGPDGDEIAVLSRAFNRMTGQLEGQRAELVDANEQIDNRRRFTEAVLFGVSAGVIGLDDDGRIFLPNRSALQLLACEADVLIGQRLESAVPEMAGLLANLRHDRRRLIQGQISLVRDGHARDLMVRIGVQGGGSGGGYVVTFDDVTDLVRAQRAAAWTDVARRVAHEIKNPLTPIQLAAERLGRKFGGDVDDPEQVFKTCVDTIVRQVGAIRSMVDEFSAFARLPAPEFADEDLGVLVAEAVALQRMAHPEIDFHIDIPEDSAVIHCDARQASQAMTNLLQNAIDAIDGRVAQAGAELAPGRIDIAIDQGDSEHLVVAVTDNGRGLPDDLAQRARLTEPYVTTREGGTGLGLAIVKKIMEDHRGEVVLVEGSKGGTVARLRFPRPEQSDDRHAEAPKEAMTTTRADGD